jgi:uncharacterized protein (TIGR02246 family)
MRRAFAAFPLFLVLSTIAVGQTTGNQSTATAGAHVQDEAEIKKELSDFEGAWNAHDAKAFSMVFAEDADFTNVRGMSAQGRTEVEKFHTPRFATNFKASHLKITGTKIRFIRPDVAAVDAPWEMIGAKTPDNKDIPLRKGLLNFVMTSGNGAWFIAVMHNMDLTPAP